MNACHQRPDTGPDVRRSEPGSDRKDETLQVTDQSQPVPLATSDRRVRSFVRRQGRLTRGQQSALETWWPQFGIDRIDEPLDFVVLFGRKAPVIVEVGFGNGNTLAQMAMDQPDHDFIGIEVHTPGVGHLLGLIGEHLISNLRIIHDDAIPALQQAIGPQPLAGLRLYFPDPWPKKRHHKRRIVNDGFVTLVADKLAPGGVFHIATDWAPYAEWMLEVMSGQPCFDNRAGEILISPRPDWRPMTKFEQRGLRLGHEIADLIFVRNDHPTELNR